MAINESAFPNLPPGLADGHVDQAFPQLNAHSIYALIASLTSHPVMISDVHGGTVWTNDAFSRLTGWSLSEIQGRKPQEFLHGPETQSETIEKIQQMVAKSLPFQTEILNYRKDGTTFWVALDAQPIRGDDGSVAGYFSVQSDVSSRKFAEDELLRDHALLKVISQTVTQFISQENSSETFRTALGHLLQLTQSEYGFIGEVLHDEQGQPFLNACAISDISWDEQSRAMYDAAASSGFAFRNLKSLFGRALLTEKPVISNAPHSDPFRGGLPPGHPPLNRFLGLPLFVGDRMVGLAGVANAPQDYGNKDVQFVQPLLICLGQLIEARHRDLHRKQVETSLREAEAMLDETGRTALIGAWQLDLLTNKLRWSDQTRRLHEVSDDFQPTVSNAIGFYHDEAQAAMAAAVQKGAEEGQSWNLELPFVTAKGNLRWAKAIGHVKFANGRPVGLYGSFQDITERRLADAEREQLQSQFLQSQKLESVGRLAGGIAHDFNNMLAVILGHTEMLLMDTTLSAQQKSQLKAIHAASQRSATMTHQLLAFARRQSATPQRLDLNKTVRQLLEFLRRSVGETTSLDWFPGEDLWEVSIDPVQVDQMLAHLCMNAREALPDGGRILMSTRNEYVTELRSLHSNRVINGPFVVLTVSDSGWGISQEVISRLFEPFATTKSVGNGPGLGLATIYGIVQQNEGAIEIESDGATGTTFRVYLPGISPVVQAPDAPKSSDAEKINGSILFVENEPALMKVGKLCLRQLGYKVHAAQGAEEAIAILKKRRPVIPLVITDVLLPGMNGWDFARRAMELQPELKFVFMSGGDQSSSAEDWRAEHPFPLLRKPFELQQLAQAIRKSLAMPLLRRESNS